MVGRMLFDTPAYLIFLPLVVLVYWRLARREQIRFHLNVEGAARFTSQLATSLRQELLGGTSVVQPPGGDRSSR